MEISLTNEQATAVLKALDIAARQTMRAADDAASGRLPHGPETADPDLTLEQYLTLQRDARREVQTYSFLSEIFRKAQADLDATRPEHGD